MTDDPSKVYVYSQSYEYITPKGYKGSCMLSTFTNSINCKWAKTMKEFVHLITLPTRSKPAQAYLQFIEDLSLKFEFEGPVLIKYLNDLFQWY